MRILNRYIITSFIFNYLLALAVMLGMYTLLDLIVNFDNFTKATSTASDVAASGSAFSVLAGIVDFYSYQMLAFFQQVSGAIPILAAGFTMVRMTRHHELTAMLASGVSLYRIAAPIILVSIGFSLLTVVNQELVISQPFMVQKLLRTHDDVGKPTTKIEPIYFVQDKDNSLLNAAAYDPDKKMMTGVIIVQRDKNGSPIGHIFADSAVWTTPLGESADTWVMHGVIQSDDTLANDPKSRVMNKVETLIYAHSSLTPEQLNLINSKKAVDLLASRQVYDLAAASPPGNQPLLYKIMYVRFTQPLMNIVMLLVGIPFLLTREPRKLVTNMVYCTILSGFVFVATFVIFQMGGTKLDPLLAAWLPVLLFGPLAAVMLDTIKT